MNREAKMRLLLSARVVAFMFLLPALGRADQAITFPDQSVGEVYVAPAGSVDFGYSPFQDAYSGWISIGDAQGAVSIPEDSVVRVYLQGSHATDLSWVDDARSDLVVSVYGINVALGDLGFRRLTQLRKLQEFLVQDANLTPAIAADLAQLDRLVSLRFVREQGVDDDLMKAVAALPRLQTFGVTDTAVTDEGLEALSRSKSLKAVFISDIAMTDTGLKSLTRLPNLRAISAFAPDPRFPRHTPTPKLTDAGIASLAACPQIDNLRLSGSQLSDDGLARLVADLPNLRRLEIDHTPVTPKGLRRLGGLAQLEELRCYGPRIDDSVATALGGLKKLRLLSGDLVFSEAGVRALATLPALERITLNGGITDASMPHIAAMPALKSLAIQNTRVTDQGFALLAGSTTLEHVQLTGSSLTTKSVETLGAMPNLKQVGLLAIESRPDDKPTWQGLGGLEGVNRELWFGMCPPLSEEDVKTLGAFAELTTLRIDGGRVLTNTDLSAISKLKNLTFLELTNTNASDTGVLPLSRLPRLERMILNCDATADGLAALARAPRLKYLSISSPSLSEADVSQVQQSGAGDLSIRFIPFEGPPQPQRSKNASDDFWRSGLAEERVELNALEGNPAPALSVSSWLNAEQGASLDTFAGRVVLIDFWGTWCGPCIKRIPEVQRLHETYGNQGLAVIGVHSTRDVENAAAYVSEEQIDWPIALDEGNQSATAYSLPHWPSYYLVDRTGLVRMAVLEPEELERAIKSLLAE